MDDQTILFLEIGQRVVDPNAAICDRERTRAIRVNTVATCTIAIVGYRTQVKSEYCLSILNLTPVWEMRQT
jgi:hypothetical protein